jgi:hypothetical protein
MRLKSGILAVAIAAGLAGCSSMSGSPQPLSAIPARLPVLDVSKTVEHGFVPSEFSLYDSPAFAAIEADARKIGTVVTWNLMFTRCDTVNLDAPRVLVHGKSDGDGWFVGTFSCSTREAEPPRNELLDLRASDRSSPAQFDYLMSLKAEANAPAVEPRNSMVETPRHYSASNLAGMSLPSQALYPKTSLGFTRVGRYRAFLVPVFQKEPKLSYAYVLSIYANASDSWLVQTMRNEYSAGSRKTDLLPDTKVQPMAASGI